MPTQQNFKMHTTKSVKPFKPHVLAFNESFGSIGTFPICKLIQRKVGYNYRLNFLTLKQREFKPQKMHSVVRTPFQDFIPKISQIDEVPGVRPKFEFYRKSLLTLRSTVPHRLLNWFKPLSVNKVFSQAGTSKSMEV